MFIDKKNGGLLSFWTIFLHFSFSVPRFSEMSTDFQIFSLIFTNFDTFIIFPLLP